MNKYHYEYKDDGDVKYCYPGTQVLVNKFNIRNAQQLNVAEREITIIKAAVLADTITGGFDLVHLKSIHKFLFEDIYEWAGQLRTVDIAKGNIFCLVPFIEMQFSELYRKLKKDHFLKEETDSGYVAEKIAYYLSEINVIHPFRDAHVIIGTRLEKPSKINGFALLSPIFLCPKGENGITTLLHILLASSMKV
jgi:cell filamentation protein